MKIRTKAFVLLCAVLCAGALGSCGVLDSLVGKETTQTTTTAPTTERNRVTTTTRNYSVSGERKKNTTTTRAEDNFDPDNLSRVSISEISTTRISGSKLTTTTTTTTTRSAYNILQSPKSDEYFNIAKAYRTKTETDLRYGPSDEYSKIQVLPKEASFSALAQSGQWYYVQIDGSTNGWIKASDVETLTKTTTTTKKSS